MSDSSARSRRLFVANKAPPPKSARSTATVGSTVLADARRRMTVSSVVLRDMKQAAGAELDQLLEFFIVSEGRDDFAR